MSLPTSDPAPLSKTQQDALDWIMLEADLGNLPLSPEEKTELMSVHPSQWTPGLSQNQKLREINAALPQDMKFL